MAIKTKPEIHGHRGARGLFPENSLAAIQAGIKHGCDAIEVDLCVTRDNHLVIHHGPILSPYLVRDGNGHWIDAEIRIRELSLAALQTYDIGRIQPESDYAARFHCQTPVDGARIPTLSEFVGLAGELDSAVIYNLELKSTPYDTAATPDVQHYVELVVRELEKFNIVERVFLQSFDWRLVMAAKTLLPRLKTGFLTDQQSGVVTPVSGKPTLWTNHHDLREFNNHIPTMIKFLGGDVWSSNHLDLTAADIRCARDSGLEVYVWTVNSQRDMARMIAMGVDAITTDYPNRLFAMLNPGQASRAECPVSRPGQS